MFLKRSMLAALLPLLAVGMLLAACGGTTAATTGSPTATTAPTAAPAAAVVMTATATVGGKSETILTNAKGMTLYYFTPDTTTTSACTSTGGCATNWPPLLFTGSGTPAASGSLSGTLSAVSSANGSQVQYNGHFLYTFFKDAKPGDTNGQGVLGKWFVATPSVAEIMDSSQATVSVATATVGGKSEEVLVNSKGMTLYIFTPDTTTKSACTGACATAWPPLTFSGSGTPASAMSLPGSLTSVTDANGAQVQYNGHFLYTFASDKKPGDTTGQGVLGKWFVATPSIAVMS